MSRASIEQILELPPSERVAIVEEIWESVVQDIRAVPLTAAQRAELEKRWVDFQQHPDEGESWDEVEKALRSE
ncbi:MAG TPA: addiction module protein [Thermoanaerobaculia bacterium]|jgi:putative addiction module component (TIGR02574 family)